MHKQKREQERLGVKGWGRTEYRQLTWIIKDDKKNQLLSVSNYVEFIC